MINYLKLWEKNKRLLPWTVGVIILIIITITTWQITNSVRYTLPALAEIKNLRSRVSPTKIDAQKFEQVLKLLAQKAKLTPPDTNKIIDPFGPLPKRKSSQPTIQEANKK